MFNFDFLEKNLGIVSPSHFVYGLSSLLEILGNMCTEADCHIFLIYIVYQFFRLDILGISFLMSLSLSGKPDKTITNPLCMKNFV